MEILTLQRRLVEVGRIRLGAKKTSQNGKQYPAKLGQFRLTSRDRQRLDAAALLYGGEVKKWESQWELFTESDALDIAVVPGQALSSAYELWGQKTTRGGKKTAVICLRRCDGQTEMLSDEPCLCAQEEGDPQCKPTTRLSVVLTKVPGLGVWRCETHGYNAAMELAGSVQLLEALVQSGRPVRARLRLDKREQKTETETRQFVVPVLDIDHTLGQVMESIGAGPSPAVGFTPVPELPAGPSVSVADQVANVGQEVKARRSNAAEPIRSTGRRPRPAADVDAPATAMSAGAGEGTTGPPSPSDPSPAPPTGNPTQQKVEQEWAQRIAMTCREVSDHLGIPHADNWRHQFIEAFTGGRTRSSKDVTSQEIEPLRTVLRGIKDGEIALVEADGAWQLEMVGPAPLVSHHLVEQINWTAEIERTPRVAETRLINRARRIANDLHVPQPPAGTSLSVLNDLDPRVANQLLAYLEEQRA